MKQLITLFAILTGLTVLAQNDWDTGTSGQISYSGGSVGIGTSSPDSKLVIGNIGTSDNTKMLGFGEGPTAGAWFESGFSPSNGDNYIKFNSPFTNMMTWKLNGNIGIGTANPDSKLVIGNIGSVNGAKLLSFSEGETGGFWFQSGFAPTGGNNYLVFRSTESNIMSWKHNGNIGIGTSNPDSKLIIGNIGGVNGTKLLAFSEGATGGFWFQSGFQPNGSDNYVEFRTGESSLMTWKHGGNIGIGTNEPDAKLEIGNIGASDNTRLLGFGEGPTSQIWFESGFSPSNEENYIELQSSYGNIMTWKRGGFVGIGTTEPNPNFKLSVNGSIRSKEVKVEANWSDFVFEEDYNLRTLEEVEQYIAEKGHLPEIPSEAEVSENGINLGEMNAKLLQKIEELTLYLIKQHEEIKALKEKVHLLAKE